MGFLVISEAVENEAAPNGDGNKDRKMTTLPSKEFSGEDEISLGRKHASDKAADLIFPSITCRNALDIWTLRATPSSDLVLLWGHLGDTLAEHEPLCPIHEDGSLMEIKTILLG